MIATIIKLPIPDKCMFSAAEAAVLWRLQEGAKPDMIASELGLAEPIVKEYIKAILRKVHTNRLDLSADFEASTTRATRPIARSRTRNRAIRLNLS
jgi:DNA-binding NarL/FixJ family response regulator